jgi:hypothetical protein
MLSEKGCWSCEYCFIMLNQNRCYRPEVVKELATLSETKSVRCDEALEFCNAKYLERTT